MSDRLSASDSRFAVLVCCYVAIQSDQASTFSTSLFFSLLRERVSKAMIGVVVEELKKTGLLAVATNRMNEPKFNPVGEPFFVPTMKLLELVERDLTSKKISASHRLEQILGVPVSSVANNSLDTWVPIVDDNDNLERKEAISAVEEIIVRVEGDNGFAATNPSARDSILYSLRTGVEMLKNHTPSREQVTANILKPLKYIGDLFAKHTIGELAKKATEKLVLWLSGF
jgi:hypothetical protein